MLIIIPSATNEEKAVSSKSRENDETSLHFSHGGIEINRQRLNIHKIKVDCWILEKYFTKTL